MASKLSPAVYEMFNERSEVVGKIRKPLNAELVGFGRGTVYLDRPMPVIRMVRPAA